MIYGVIFLFIYKFYWSLANLISGQIYPNTTKPSGLIYGIYFKFKMCISFLSGILNYNCHEYFVTKDMIIL